jgi:acetyl/propionyl-CoA carboxylase alpha subunit
MRRALEEYRIVGIQSNIPFHLGVLSSIDFQRGRLDTRFVERYLEQGRVPEPEREEFARVAAMAGALIADRKRTAGGVATPAPNGREDSGQSSNWRVAGRKAGLR